MAKRKLNEAKSKDEKPKSSLGLTLNVRTKGGQTLLFNYSTVGINVGMLSGMECLRVFLRDDTATVLACVPTHALDCYYLTESKPGQP